MKKVYYFDMGLCDGIELKWIVEDIFPSLGIENYHAYGFEPCADFYNNIVDYFADNKNVTIINSAISNENGIKKLYYSWQSKEGHSLFDSKINVSKDKYENVSCIKFSDYLDGIPDITSCFNILRFNIEGAEWDLINDMLESGYRDAIDIFCGAGDDVDKIEEYKGKTHKYYNALKDNDIVIRKFCAIYKESKDKIQKIIKSQMGI